MRVYHGLAFIWGVWIIIAAYSRGIVEGAAMAGMDTGLSWWWLMVFQTIVAAGASLMLFRVGTRSEGN